MSAAMSAFEELRLSAACDVSFPLRVGFDEHPLIAAIRSCCRGD